MNKPNAEDPKGPSKDEFRTYLAYKLHAAERATGSHNRKRLAKWGCLWSLVLVATVAVLWWLAN